MTDCAVGTKISCPLSEEDSAPDYLKNSSPFFGQIGPIYMFSEAISSEQVQDIYSLGPSYMYSFLDNEAAFFNDCPFPKGILDAKDGLGSRIIFGFNAQVFVFLLIRYILLFFS